MAVASDYSGWVKDLDSFKPSIEDDDDDEEDRVKEMSGHYTSVKNGMKKNHVSQLDEIKQEMKLLNWHKLANEAALKAALIKTKKLKRDDARQLSLLDAEERMERIQQIEEEENMKPLEVTTEFIRKYEEDEKREERRLEADVARHINCLKKLKIMLEEREELRRRHIQYREGKLALENGYPMNSNQEDDAYREEIKSTARSTSNSNDVTRELSSLDKLVELERRISCLEKEDFEPASVATVAPLIHAAKGTLKFTKTSNGRRTAQNITKIKPKIKNQTFLTGLPEEKIIKKKTIEINKSNEIKRAAELRRMSERDREKAIRIDKKIKNQISKNQQNYKINQWIEKKKQAATSRKINYIKSNMINQIQNKTKNNHLNQFQKIKAGYELKKNKSKQIQNSIPIKKRSSIHIHSSKPISSIQSWNTKPKPPNETRLLPMIHGRVKTTTTIQTKEKINLPIIKKSTIQFELGIQGIKNNLKIK